MSCTHIAIPRRGAVLLRARDNFDGTRVLSNSGQVTVVDPAKHKAQIR